MLVRTCAADGLWISFLRFVVKASPAVHSQLLSINLKGEFVMWDLETEGVSFILELNARASSICVADSLAHLYVGTSEGAVLVVNIQQGYKSSYAVELAQANPEGRTPSDAAMPRLDLAVVGIFELVAQQQLVIAHENGVRSCRFARNHRVPRTVDRINAPLRQPEIEPVDFLGAPLSVWHIVRWHLPSKRTVQRFKSGRTDLAAACANYSASLVACAHRDGTVIVFSMTSDTPEVLTSAVLLRFCVSLPHPMRPACGRRTLE
jgi:hypothetical protein